MERCITFIGDNAADCVKTNAFLNLPKEALIKLISSDFVSTQSVVFRYSHESSQVLMPVMIYLYVYRTKFHQNWCKHG